MENTKTLKPLRVPPRTPKLWRLLKFPVAGISAAEPGQTVKGIVPYGMLRTLAPSGSGYAIRTSGDGDLFILQSQGKRFC